MMLQSSLKNPNAYLSPAVWNSRPVGPKARSLRERKRNVVVGGVRCSVSQVHSYGTVDFERRPPLKWDAIYRRISQNEDSSLTCGTLLERWETEYQPLTKWELCRIVRELRKYSKYPLALQVYEWMGNREERYRLSSSDAAIQLDLVGKVHGVAEAEKFFLGLSESFRDKRVFGAMLNSYVRAKNKEKAEALLEQIKARDYATHCLPYNVMMTLYRNLKEYEKVEALTAEMIEKKINMDVYSYNIWLSCRGAQGTAEGIEEVFEKMKADETVNPNWTTFSTMATMYIKMGLFEKAEECLRKVESRITGRDREPYHFLLTLYGGIGKKDEVYRIWNAYKRAFHIIPNMGYHAIFSSLLRFGDIEESEKIYEEWLQIKNSYDPRIGNLFVGYYVENGNLEKALNFVDSIAEVGGKPNSGSWEALAAGFTAERKVSEALSYWKKAFAAEGSKYWRSKPYNVSAFFDLCNVEADLESKEVLEGMLKQAGHLKDESDPSETALPQEAADEESALALN